MRPTHTVAVCLIAVLVATGELALAVDGVIEINQAKALAGGVSPGDSPGFPVTIDSPGSYRLTGDLLAVSTDGIQVMVNDVTLDLNGFTLRGNPAGPLSDGVNLFGFSNIEVRNGTVSSFTRHGVFNSLLSRLTRVIGVRAISNTFSGIEVQGGGSLVDGCSAFNNALGIRITDGSILNSIATRNTGLGLSLTATCGYRSNVVTENNGGNANPQVTAAGNQLGPNVCGNDLNCP